MSELDVTILAETPKDAQAIERLQPHEGKHPVDEAYGELQG